MRSLALPIPAAVLAVLIGCTSTPTLHENEELLVLEVAPDSVPCVGEMAGNCIQVRSPGEALWHRFYDPIEGFRHEVGVRYTLSVARRAIADPPADGSAAAYRLVRIIDRDPGGV